MSTHLRVSAMHLRAAMRRGFDTAALARIHGVAEATIYNELIREDLATLPRPNTASGRGERPSTVDGLPPSTGRGLRLPASFGQAVVGGASHAEAQPGDLNGSQSAEASPGLVHSVAPGPQSVPHLSAECRIS
jgi:hypothetical protein